MTIKDQWKKIKSNWLIILVIFALLLVMNFGGVSDLSYSVKNSVSREMGMTAYDSDESYRSSYIPSPQGGFAPDVEERKITKSASISTEVERGDFRSAEKSLKNMIVSSDSYIINENVNKYGNDRQEYYQGGYDIRVDTTKYDAFISQLKSIGEVQSFSEYTDDVTEKYANAEINLETEKARLERYKEMYTEAKEVEDKLNINDRIFDQERTIKYLEDSLKNIDERIDYTTIYFTLTEKRASYADFVLFSSLVGSFVGSVNTLLVFIVTIIPWAIIILIAIVVWRFVKKK